MRAKFELGFPKLICHQPAPDRVFAFAQEIDLVVFHSEKSAEFTRVVLIEEWVDD